jgi:DNA-binding FadR family transcriptional regulator
MAATRRTAADLTRLEQALQRHRESEGDSVATFAADAEFHRLIVEFSRSETLQVLSAMVTDIIREGDRSYAETHDRVHEGELVKIALRAHTRLVELIRKRNGEEAEQLWRKHLTESAKIVLADRPAATVVELLS